MLNGLEKEVAYYTRKARWAKKPLTAKGRIPPAPFTRGVDYAVDHLDQPESLREGAVGPAINRFFEAS